MTAKFSVSIVLSTVLMFFSAIAAADCFENGKQYPVGAVVTGKVCTPQGWRTL